MTAAVRGAAATPHRLATDAALQCLGDGGNAVDAALAAAAVLTVVYPNQCSIGGDLIALVGLPDGSAHVVNGIGRAAAALSPEAVGAPAMPLHGPLTVTVPGVVAGWRTLSEHWGTGRLADTLRAAGRLAGDGVAVAPGLARAIDEDQQRVLADPGLASVLAPGGRLLVTGSVLRQPALADSLSAIAETSGAALYTGEIGRSVVATLNRLGSPMTVDDLAGDVAEVVEPVRASYAGAEFLSSPPPSQGGCFLAGLTALDLMAAELGRSLDPVGGDATAVAAVLQAAADERDLLLADPLAPRATGDTVAVVVADDRGTWVSLIQSVFHAFGSGILDPDTGIVLHNRGAAFSLDPASPAVLRGGARPPHTLMPVLVREGDRFVGAHGTMGGRAQPQIHTHLALALAAGASPAETVGRPRWVLSTPADGPGTPRAVIAEGGVDPRVLDALRADGHPVAVRPRLSDDVGHAQLVRRTADRLVAATDPRADGAWR